jgi:hypothetical protein
MLTHLGVILYFGVATLFCGSCSQGSGASTESFPRGTSSTPYSSGEWIDHSPRGPPIGTCVGVGDFGSISWLSSGVA